MTVQNYVTPTNKICVTGEPARIRYKNISTVANCYPARLAVRGTTDYDIKCSDGILPPIGIIGYEQAPDIYRLNDMGKIYTLGDEVPVISGGEPTIYAPLGLAAGTYVTEGDPLLSWTAGQYIPGSDLDGKTAIKIPFINSATASVSTGIALPAGIRVVDCIACITAGNGGGVTLSVGLGESGTANGFLAAEVCSTLGYIAHNSADATTGNITLGSYLTEVKIVDATAVTPVFVAVPVSYVTDGTHKTIYYTTTNTAALTGYILLVVESLGIKKVGKAGSTVDATGAAAITAGGANIFVEASI